MYSGGDIRLDPYKVQDTGGNRADSTISEEELKAGLIDTSTGLSVSTIDDAAKVKYGDKIFTWKELKQELGGSPLKKKGDRLSQADNVSPADVATRLSRNKSEEGQKLANELEILKKAKSEGKSEATLPDGAKIQKANFESSIAERTQQLQRIITQLQQSNVAQGKNANEGIDPKWLSATNLTGENQSGNGSNGNGASGNTFRAQMAPQQGFVPANMAAQQAGAAGGGAAANLFDGLTPPASTAGYGAGLFMDGMVSDGLGNVFASRREGQRLMMLFLYYARMAASGDLGAMYQLTQFLNYVISKDKAKQNIQISGKLIQLQDMSRKATDALLKTKADGQNEGEFLKALHKAKADEGTISTSQKLLADMLQEFAHVVEAMTNSAKFMLDAWGRVLRTITRP